MRTRRYPHYLAFSVAMMFAIGTSTVPSIARQSVKPFPVAQLFLELNDTDGDLGLHAEIDGDPWTSLDIVGPGARNLLSIVSKGALRRHALTQIAFESAEPQFDDLAPAETFRRFPEGKYEIGAIRQDGRTYKSVVKLSHVLAAPAVATVNTLEAAESCDDTPLPAVDSPVLVNWKSVTTSHPTIGETGSVTISRYQFFVERDAMKLGVDLPPTITQFRIPTALTASPGVYKFEIIARTSTGNNTAVESCFRVR